MNRLLSIIIPIAPHHETVAHEAYASAMAQNVPCEIIPIKDHDMRGAGWTRNQGLEKAKCDFVTFLDADDILSPHFAEMCLSALSHYAQSHTEARYAYTDWIGDGDKPIIAPLPCAAWTDRTFHLVTAVVPTERARLIGGFDENMTGLEDADFYLRLRLSGVCGLHIHAPSNPLESALVSYRDGGQRSIQARMSGQETLIQQYMLNRYGGYNLMGCCGDSTQLPPTPGNEPREGWVLVQAQWHGNRAERGRVTGAIYPRTSHPHLMYVDPRDADAAPQHWKRVTSPTQAANGIILQPAYAPQATPWQDIANAMADVAQVRPAPSQPIQYKPNKTSVTKKQAAGEWVKIEGNDL